MKRQFTTSYIEENSGCYKNEEGKLKKLFEENNKTCFEEANCVTTIEEIMSSSIPTEDKYWFLFKGGVLELEERKELFLLVMKSVDENTTDVFTKEYIATLIKYAAREATWRDVYNAYVKTPGVSWVVCRYGNSDANLSSGLYFAHYLLMWVNRDVNVKEIVWNVVREYVLK